MKRFTIILAALVVLVISSSAFAASEFWLTDKADGTQIAGDVLTIAPGAEFTLYCFVTAEAGKTWAVLAGYDTTTDTYGEKALKDGNGKLSLVGSADDVKSTINSTFQTTRTVKLGGARESANVDMGGRPWGLYVNGATGTSFAPSAMQLFSFTLKSAMAADGDTAHVVIAADSTSSTWTSFWISSPAMRDAYSLTVKTVKENPVVPEPSSMIALGSGVLGLFGIIRRRRS